MTRSILVLGAALVATALSACGSKGGGTPTSGTPTTTTTTGGGNPQTATITIGTDGRVSPSSVTVAQGGRVTFVNNHTRPHDMSSDPHPEHTQCPEINQVGFLTAGQQRTTGNLNTVRTCGFHDHNEPGNAGLLGSIIIR